MSQKNLDDERTIEEMDIDYNAICNNNEEEPVFREPVFGSTLGDINNDVNDNDIDIKEDLSELASSNLTTVSQSN